MFSRNISYAGQLTHKCNHPLVQQFSKSNPFERTRLYVLKNSFHNSRRNVRRPVIEDDPLSHFNIETGPLYINSLIKPFLFTIGVSAAGVVGCAIWEYECLKSHTAAIFKRSSSWLNAHQKSFTSQFKAETEPVKKWWSSLKDSDKVFFPILAINLLVFAGWKIRALQPIMVKYFCSNPAGGAVCLPMVLSTFSHYSALHLAANMYVLYSFMPAAVATMGKEQFVSMYLSGGVISSLFSFINKVMFNQPGLSLGASGAIMSVLAYVCVQYPDTKLSIIFLPMYTFAAGTAIKAIMAVDLAGVVCGWKFFDHAAHLGGALFGIFWCYWGSKEIWGNRDKVVQYYHHLRKNDSGR